MDIYPNTPYTYRIGWSKTGMNYYGVRYAKDCHPSDLFVTYFTSSEYVADHIKEHGLPDIIEVRQTFTTPSRVDEAREWESRVLTKLKVTKNTKYLNQSTGKGIPPLIGDLNPMRKSENKEKFLEVVRSAEHRYKQGIPVRQKVLEGTHHFIGSEVNKKRVENGTHQFLGGEIQGKSSRARVENGTHNFLGGEILKQMIENGTHPWLGSKQNDAMLANGTHPSQIKMSCEHCDKTVSKGMYIRWHGVNCRARQDKK
jgi:hypothetical protein